MILFLLAYAGGVLTIASPCILPVLPFVFARADRPFIRSGLPMLVGMAATFAVVATLAAVAGGWAVEANRYGRLAAISLLALFGLALLFPGLADRLTRPLVALGARLSQTAARDEEKLNAPILPSLLLGVATGLLWAPCAGPVLGLILTGAALQGASVETSLLLLAYAAGAATSLALALLVGGRVFAAMKRSLGVGEWIRRGLGVAVLAAVVAIALGLDTGFLTRVSLASTASLEQGLLDKVGASSAGPAMTSGNPAPASGSPAMMMAAKPPASTDLPIEGTLPALSGAVAWLNSPPLTAEALKGKVVLVDFWTYSCINCLRAIPYVRAWAEKYRDQGLVVIGVHAPEFAFEKNIDNVRMAVADLKLDYPVAIDNDYAIWRAFNNQYWPAHYFVDAQGRIRHHHFGEGDYDESERVIQQLIAEAGKTAVASDLVSVTASGAEVAADMSDILSPETYVGYARAENFISPGGAVQDARHVYTAPTPRLNEWALSGDWTIGGEHAALNDKDGGIVYRFHARDLHLVLGPAPDGKPVRFRVTIDGAAPGDSHGTDIDAEGQGTVTAQRLYQLVRQNGAIADHTFEIRFLDPGVQAYAFTFG
ncbi:MAG TPA: cytochrome c biogenesis protein CcdA [Methylomirabilota bacterium]|nr:cytochrome c biogenesis protein CcdA [Methylomirabilota bacterium]